MTSDNKRLNYTELVNILSILAVRQERIEAAFSELLRELDKQTEFQNYEILSVRRGNIREDNRTPRGRLNYIERQLIGIEEQFAGMVNFVNQSLFSKRRKSKKEYQHYLDE